MCVVNGFCLTCGFVKDAFQFEFHEFRCTLHLVALHSPGPRLPEQLKCACKVSLIRLSRLFALLLSPFFAFVLLSLYASNAIEAELSN